MCFFNLCWWMEIVSHFHINLFCSFFLHQGIFHRFSASTIYNLIFPTTDANDGTFPEIITIRSRFYFTIHAKHHTTVFWQWPLAWLFQDKVGLLWYPNPWCRPHRSTRNFNIGHIFLYMNRICSYSHTIFLLTRPFYWYM